MTKQNRKSPLANLWVQMVGELRLHANDFWQLALIPFGALVLMGLIFGGMALVSGADVMNDLDPPYIVGAVLSVAPVAVAVFTGLLTAGSLFGVYYKLGIQMGQTRRAMLVRMGLLSLVEHAAVLAFSAGLGSLVTLGYRQFFAQGTAPLALVPWWGWVLMLTLPVAFGTFGGAVILRFGRKGFWVLYAIFMSIMLLPQFFTDLVHSWEIDVWVERIAQLTVEMPQLVCLLSVIPFFVGVALLWRMPIRD